MAPRTLALLILAALAVAILIGCSAGSGGSSLPQPKQQASETTGPSGRKAEGTDPSGQVAVKRLGHPALGSADAPVVLTEYSDYQ